MKRILFCFAILLFLLPSCSKKTGANIRVVKPKYHHRWYDRKKDKRTKRLRSVRVQN